MGNVQLSQGTHGREGGLQLEDAEESLGLSLQNHPLPGLPSWDRDLPFGMGSAGAQQ